MHALMVKQEPVQISGMATAPTTQHKDYSSMVQHAWLFRSIDSEWKGIPKTFVWTLSIPGRTTKGFQCELLLLRGGGGGGGCRDAPTQGTKTSITRCINQSTCGRDGGRAE